MLKIDHFFIFLIFTLSVCIGLAYLQFGYVFPAESGDSAYYIDSALNFTESGEFFSHKIVARSGPGYPLFLIATFKIFGQENYGMVRILQIFLLAGMGILLFVIARKLLNLSPIFAFFSSLTLIFWPYFIVWSSLILTEIIFIFFFLLSILFILKFQKGKLLGDSFLAALTLGIATLIRPEIILIPFWIFLLWLIFKRNKQDLKINLKKVALSVLILAAIMSPWLTKNVILHQNLLPVYSFSGWSSESGRETGNISFYLLEKIAEKPIQTVKNMIYFWNPGAQGLRAEALLENYRPAELLFLIYKIIYFIILGAAFLSLFSIKKGRIFLLWAIISYYWIIHGLIFPSPRHTLPIIPLVILLAWMSAEALYHFFRSGKFIISR